MMDTTVILVVGLLFLLLHNALAKALQVQSAYVTALDVRGWYTSSLSSNDNCIQNRQSHQTHHYNYHYKRIRNLQLYRARIIHAISSRSYKKAFASIQGKWNMSASYSDSDSDAFSSSSSSSSLPSSPSSLSSSLSLVDRLDLGDRFGRWRFLQKLLDRECDPQDINELVFEILRIHQSNKNSNNDNGIQYRASAESPNARSHGGGELILTEEQKRLVSDLLNCIKKGGEVPLFVLQQPESDSVSLEGLIKEMTTTTTPPTRTREATVSIPRYFCDERVLRQLEALLPDPHLDEDAFKGLWDTVIELHGRAAVQLEEEASVVSTTLVDSDSYSYGVDETRNGEGASWNTCSIIARLLIHLDFLATRLA